jgi:Bacterial TSP3 repeat
VAMGTTRLRTSVVSLDSDGDELADGDERDYTRGRLSWVVQVAGAAPYQAAPRPYDSDADRDGLTDKEELALRTDPNLADTDGDGTSDREESRRTGRNPLAADKYVQVTYTAIVVNDQCGNQIGPHAAWKGMLQIVPPTGSEVIDAFFCDDCCPVNPSGSCPIATSTSFTGTVTPGQVIRLRSGANWEELNAGFASGDVGTFLEDRPYNSLVSTPVTTIDFRNGRDCTRSLSVQYSVTVN